MSVEQEFAGLTPEAPGEAHGPETKPHAEGGYWFEEFLSWRIFRVTHELEWWNGYTVQGGECLDFTILFDFGSRPCVIKFFMPRPVD